ncbi:hypothetical protein ACWC5I_47950 [Kitasatospora sp. NPDC001574]
MAGDDNDDDNDDDKRNHVQLRTEGAQMTSMVTVNIRYTPPGMAEEDSIEIEFQAPPGARVELRLTEPGTALPLPPVVLKKEARDRCLELIIETRNEGTGATALHRILKAEGYPTSRTTAQEWLTQWCHAGEIVREERVPKVACYHHTYAAG